MLLTLTTTHQPATDLGYLLHKNPANVQVEELSFGKAYVFYPEANEERCTVALVLEIDPVGLVRGRGAKGDSGPLDAYVNDRPYAASSFLTVALKKLFNTAMAGKSKERPELVETVLPLQVHIPVVACQGGVEILGRLFDPLGYEVDATSISLDSAHPEWGPSPYFDLKLTGNLTLKVLLDHLYVLIPVLDNDKHYFVGEDEIEKLLRRGGGWLSNHPEKEMIVARYLKRQRRLTREALSQLLADDPSVELEAAPEVEAPEEPKTLSIHTQRLRTVLEAIKASGAKRVLDLGCGEGRLLKYLLADRQFEYILGMDVSYRALEFAADRLDLGEMTQRQRARIDLMQGSLTYRDDRLSGFDAAAVVEVIEHLDKARLASFERAVFEFAKPGYVALTTPNAEYNAKFENLHAGEFRHKDHRFEWTRQQFEDWANGVAERFGYSVEFAPVGEEDPAVGALTQMALFTMRGGAR